jgi:hypothetical protein
VAFKDLSVDIIEQTKNVEENIKSILQTKMIGRIFEI